MWAGRLHRLQVTLSIGMQVDVRKGFEKILPDFFSQSLASFLHIYFTFQF